MPMESFILGTGGMMPLPNRNLTSMLLRREGELFLFDCGEATQVSLRQLNLKWKKISVVLISHTHADHITGLPGILMLTAQVERSEPLVIIGPPKVKEYVDTSRRVLDMHINYPIEVREIAQPYQAQEVYRGDGYGIRAFPLKHSRVCVGYAFIEEPRPGVFFPEKAVHHRVPRGPLWGRLQAGMSVTLEDGSRVEPLQVMGEPRGGAQNLLGNGHRVETGNRRGNLRFGSLDLRSDVRGRSGRFGQGEEASHRQAGGKAGGPGRRDSPHGAHPFQPAIHEP